MNKISQKSLWFDQVHKCSLRELALTVPDSGFSLINSQHSLVSAGTEKLVLAGKVPLSAREVMRVPYMKGDFEFPLSYGYSLVGEIIQGENTGKMAHVMHPHADYAVVKNDPKKATLLSNAETVINAVWDGKVSLGENVLVLGFGIIGQMLCALLKHMGFEVTVVDPLKATAIKNQGFYQLSQDEKFDKIYNCTASAEALQNGIDLLKSEGTLIELSWYGDNAVNLRLGESFHYYRKRIVSSQVSIIPGEMSSKWNYKRRKELAVSLIEKGVFDSLVLNEVSFEDSPNYFVNMSKEKSNKLTVIKY